MKVFLGGTCNQSTWRNIIIPMLEIEYFNPVVDDWTPECMAEEIKQRQEWDFCLYVITPKMTGVYSIAEVVDDSNKRPNKTIFIGLRDDGSETFNDGQWRSMGALAKMVEENGAKSFSDLKSAAMDELSMRDYGEFCRSAVNCEHFIEWEMVFDVDYRPYPCESCRLVGQSYVVDTYPDDCPHITAIKFVKIDVN